MYKNTSVAIALALSAMLASTPASALSLNPRGLGQVLLFPYYTVNKNQDTLLSVINTSEHGKVAKVRFLEGYNGRSVLEFFVFLSAHDVWTATLGQAAADGGAKIVTHDASCIYPHVDESGNDMRVQGIAFRPFAYASISDGGPTSIARTREGHFEIVADGDIIPGSPTDLRVSHVQNGTPGGGRPSGCDALPGNFGNDLVTPTSGLAGSATIINVGEGTFFAYNAQAISGFTSVPFTSTSAGSQSADTLAQANTGDSNIAGAAAVASVPAGADATLELGYTRGVDAVSAVLMADSLYNEYLVADGLGANTDWIVTFPTKKFYADPFVVPQAPLAPFVERFNAHSNVLVVGDLYDQEEFHLTTGIPPEGCGFLCPSFVALQFPYEVNVLSFLRRGNAGDPSGVVGSQLATNVVLFNNAPYGDAGWLRINLNSSDEPHSLPGGMSAAGKRYFLHGLPAAGFMTYAVINGNAAPGKLANYSGAFTHRESASCEHDGDVSTGGDPCT
ncbi:MAG: hypothetical protein ABIW82_13710 [Dokdonella sp.]